MLNSEWANPSPIMFNGDGDGGAGGGLEELISQSIQTTKDHMISDQYNNSQTFEIFNDATIVTPVINPHHRMLTNPNFFDPLSAAVDGGVYPPSPPPLLSPEILLDNQAGFFLMPKLELPYIACNIDFTNSLNLYGLMNLRTYFSPEEDDIIVNQYEFDHGRRSRAVMEAGVMMNMNSVSCQIEGCNADLSHARHYHRRHKVCEFHSKVSTVLTAGLPQRYCQQCSRFHILSEFDEGKRSCRKRLADHNRRRRKPSHNEASNLINDQPLKNVTGSAPDP